MKLTLQTICYGKLEAITNMCAPINYGGCMIRSSNHAALVGAPTEVVSGAFIL